MSDVLYWSSLLFVGAVIALVLFRLYVGYQLRCLQDFALNWKTLDECVAHGLNKSVCTELLVLLYEHNVIEVRLREIKPEELGVEIEGPEELSDETAEAVTKLTDVIIEVYNQVNELEFNNETIDFYEFRFKAGTSRRRRWTEWLPDREPQLSY